MLEAYDNDELNPGTDTYRGRTIPEIAPCDERAADSGSNVPDGGTVRKNNPAASALQRFQNQMNGEAEKSGLFSEEDVADWITESRRKRPDEC